MVVDVWMQHPTPRFLGHDMFDSLRRWTGQDMTPQEVPIEFTLGALDDGGVRVRAAVGVARPGGAADLERRGRGLGRRRTRSASPASRASTCAGRLTAVRELRRCVERARLQGPARDPVAVGAAADRPRATTRCCAACAELGVPFCTQVGHTGPLRTSETGRPIPYIDDVAIDFPELVIVCGHIGYPWTEEMVAVARKHENVYIDTSAYTARRYPPELVRYMQRDGRRRSCSAGTTR